MGLYLVFDTLRPMLTAVSSSPSPSWLKLEEPPSVNINGFVKAKFSCDSFIIAASERQQKDRLKQRPTQDDKQSDHFQLYNDNNLISFEIAKKFLFFSPSHSRLSKTCVKLLFDWLIDWLIRVNWSGSSNFVSPDLQNFSQIKDVRQSKKRLRHQTTISTFKMTSLTSRTHTTLTF